MSTWPPGSLIYVRVMPHVAYAAKIEVNVADPMYVVLMDPTSRKWDDIPQSVAYADVLGLVGQLWYPTLVI